MTLHVKKTPILLIILEVVTKLRKYNIFMASMTLDLIDRMGSIFFFRRLMFLTQINSKKEIHHLTLRITLEDPREFF